LDWDGLNISAEIGYRTVDFSGEEPKVMQAIESGSWQGSSVKGIYWGSHNEDLRNGIVFTTFGDHHTQPRMGLPDLAWQTGRKLREIEAVDNLKPVLLRTLHTILYQGLMEETGKIMMILRDGKRTGLEISHFVELEPERIQLLLELLEVLQYIRKEKEYYETVIPVFSPDDREMVQDILKIGRKVIVDWFERNFERLRSCLSVLSAYHYGQSLELTFYKVWHEIFGAANRMLCERGMFIDPYNSGRKYPGFIPVVWHVDVDAGMKKIK